jgi:hypothetical protein
MKARYVKACGGGLLDLCTIRIASRLNETFFNYFISALKECGPDSNYGRLDSFDRLLVIKSRMVEAARIGDWYPPVV